MMSLVTDLEINPNEKVVDIIDEDPEKNVTIITENKTTSEPYYYVYYESNPWVTTLIPR